MSEENESSETKKKYKVVDKRPNYEEEAPASDTEPQQAPEPEAQAAAPPESSEQPEQQPPPHEQQPGDEEQQQRSVQIQDLVALTLNLLRDQAVVSLGMHFTAGPASGPDMDAASKAATLYRDISGKYDDIVQSFIPEEYKNQPPPPSDLISSLAMAINLVQSQALILMGLIADPSTGLVVKDMAQAKKAIDFLAVLNDSFKPHLPEEAVKNVQNAISDLRVNYINQLNSP